MSSGSTPPLTPRDSFSGSENFNVDSSSDDSTETLSFPTPTSEPTVHATSHSPSPPAQTVSTAAKTNSTGDRVVKENGRLKRAYEWVKNQFVAKKLSQNELKKLGDITETWVKKFEDLGTDMKWKGLVKGSGATVMDADALATWVAKDKAGRAHGKGVIVSDPVSVYQKETTWNIATQQWDTVEKKVGEYRHVTTAQFKHGQIVGDLLEERYLVKDPTLFENKKDPLEKTVSKPSPFSTPPKPSIPDPDLTEEPVSFNPPAGCTRNPTEFEGGTLSIDYDRSGVIQPNPNAIWRDSNNNHYLVSVNEQGQVDPNSWRAVTVDTSDALDPKLVDPQSCRMPLTMFQSEVARNGLPTDFADRLKEYSAHPGFVENQDVGGKSYTGFVDANQKPIGLGILKEPAAIQQGMFANGNLIEGKRSNPDGTVYLEGKFDSVGKLEGHGTKVTADSKYEGHFTAGEYNGAGTLTSKDGNVHEGMFVDGQKHGFGRASKPNPDRDPVLSPHLPERLEESGLYENGNHVAGTGKVDFPQGAVFYGQVTADPSGKQVPAAGKGFITMSLPNTQFINEGDFDNNATPIGAHKITSTALDVTVEADYSTNPPTVKDNPFYDAAGRKIGSFTGAFQNFGDNGLPIPLGRGELVFNDGVKFTGTFANGNLVRGRKEYPDETMLTGEFDNEGRLNGDMVELKSSNGSVYTGKFVAGEFIEGHCTDLIEDPDGELTKDIIYIGTYKKDEPRSTGIMKFDLKREVHEGEFFHRNLVKGKKTFRDGGVMEGSYDGFGDFQNGMATNVSRPEGWKYTGPYHNGKPNGEGEVSLPDGGVWKGKFKDGLPEGEGVLTLENGTRFEAGYGENGFGPV